MFRKNTIKFDPTLWEKITHYSNAMGYASPEEFVVHSVEKELGQLESADTDEDIQNRLKGLGYIE